MADGILDRAMAEHRAGRLEPALELYGQALARQPQSAVGHNAAGVALMQLGRVDEAVAAWHRAVALGYAPAHSNLGTALQRQGRLDEAVAAYREALRLNPGHAEAHYNLGSALQEQFRLDEAVECYQAALRVRAAYPQACNNLGIALRDLGRLEEAVEAYRRALALEPGHAEAHYNLGMALLEQGDLVRGFAEYEWRFAAGISSPRAFTAPAWRGEDVTGRTVLVWAEQGFGDALQFCRYVPLLAARGARVVVEVQRPLVRLLQSLAGVAAVVARGDALPRFDTHVSMVSLPALLGTSLETIPAATPYVQPPAGLVEEWRRRLAQRRLGLGNRPRVGLVWAGNPDQKNDRNRSMSLRFAADLAGSGGVDWVSLQVGAAAGTLAGIVDAAPDLTDFAETAAAIEALDLVVGVDTAVIHLAGALGRPVWAMLTRLPDFRYLREREDCPWYPSMRLFRQQVQGDWAPVVAQVASALREGIHAGPR